MPTDAQMLAHATALVQDLFVGAMTTVDPDGQPHCRYMGAAMEDSGLKKLYTLTGQHTRKLQYLEKNPCVSWLFADSQYQSVVMLKGKAQVLTSPLIAQKAWERLADAARTYSVNALSDENNTDFAVIVTEVTYVDLLWPEQGIVTPQAIDLSAGH